MFTRHIPRTGSPVGKSHSVFSRIGASVGVISLSAGLALVAAPAANAAPIPVSWAEAKFLSGSVLGINLDRIAQLQPAQASNDGSQDKQTQNDNLQASVLDTVNVNAPNGIQLSLGQILEAGAVGQYAEAEKTGNSLAATGAVGDDGGVGVGNPVNGPAGDLDLDLDALLNPSFSSIITDLTLSLDAVSAQAMASGTSASGSYTIADAKLNLTSPAVGELTEKVNSVLDKLDARLLSIGSDDGPLGDAVDRAIDPVLGAVGSSANVTVSIDTDLKTAVQDILTSKYGNGAVSFDLETGAVSVDLEKLLGGELNDLAPGTEILSDKVINKVLQGITDTVATLADQIVDKVEAALHNSTLTVKANLNLLTPQNGGSTKVCHVIDLPIVGDVLGDVLGGDLGGLGDLLDLPGVNQLSDLTSVLNQTQINQLTEALGVSSLSSLDGLTDLSSLTNVLQGSGSGSGLGGALGGLLGRTLPGKPLQQATICELVKNIVPDLQSTVNVDIVGTVDDIIDGTAAKADVAVSLLGGTVAANLSADAILGSLGSSLDDSLFGDDGSVQQLVDDLNTGLVNPAVTGLLGDGDSVSTILTDLVSVKANVQELTPMAGGQKFTETAVRVSVLPTLAASAAVQLNVAQAAVGPNATVVTPPTCTNGTCTPCVGSNCTPIPDPCVTNCTTAAADRLAYTGVGIATLIAVILALLAAGAYLAREGYRRNHTQSASSD